MPEHIHLLITEPERGTPSTVMQVLKQRFARQVLRELDGWPTLFCFQPEPCTTEGAPPFAVFEGWEKIILMFTDHRTE